MPLPSQSTMDGGFGGIITGMDPSEFHESSRGVMSSKLSTNHLRELAKDGWWPYFEGHEQSVEATAWCSIACRKIPELNRKTLDYWISTQTKDGGWATQPGIAEPDWTSALALTSLQILCKELATVNGEGDRNIITKANDVIGNGINRLASSRVNLMSESARTLAMIFNGPEYDYPHGWSWSPHTYNWIEPSSYAMIAINVGDFAREKRLRRQVEQAQKYFIQKECAGGGWNYGCPETMGYRFLPMPGPTGAAVLALQDMNHPVVDRAFSYLHNLPELMQTPSASSLHLIAADAHGKLKPDELAKQAKILSDKVTNDSGMTNNLVALAQATIASALPTAGNPLKWTARTTG